MKINLNISRGTYVQSEGCEFESLFHSRVVLKKEIDNKNQNKIK